ncbi:piggyBac transposable element-derived protein 4 isoform X1 [Vespula maculifrons]|uniref:PiggyBac transposable element-derived protein 4 isoform X1 n=1 Tax=Vespula maculifrons TaxID=7453 RepID=A0ABD2B3V4_VESMC
MPHENFHTDAEILLSDNGKRRRKLDNNLSDVPIKFWDTYSDKEQSQNIFMAPKPELIRLRTIKCKFEDSTEPNVFSKEVQNVEDFADLFIESELIELISMETYTQNSNKITTRELKEILSVLHFSDNNSMPNNTDWLFKVQSIIDYFSKKFCETFNLRQNIFIDKVLRKLLNMVSSSERYVIPPWNIFHASKYTRILDRVR